MNVNNIVLSIEEILEDENESQTNLEKYYKEYLKQRNIDRSERFKQIFMEIFWMFRYLKLSRKKVN